MFLCGQRMKFISGKKHSFIKGHSIFVEKAQFFAIESEKCVNETRKSCREKHC